VGALRAHRDFTALGIGCMNVYLDEELLSAWEAPHLGAGNEVGQALLSFDSFGTACIPSEVGHFFVPPENGKFFIPS
jgi:hypothetical protein